MRTHFLLFAVLALMNLSLPAFAGTPKVAGQPCQNFGQTQLGRVPN
jgi:hypothetical protein